MSGGSGWDTRPAPHPSSPRGLPPEPRSPLKPGWGGAVNANEEMFRSALWV